MRKIALLGCTGSIGCQSLDVIAQHPETLQVVAMTANHNAERFIEQVLRFRPQMAGLADEKAAAKIAHLIPRGTTFVAGKRCLDIAAGWPEADTALVAVVGIAGLPCVMRAIAAGKDVALANKEALVTGGALVMSAAKEAGVFVLPVDSEHSAIFQCMQAHDDRQHISRVLLTASGGPFRTWDRARIAAATAAQALQHPTWNMGAKVTIDSATLMNKGLEVMEAQWLFGAFCDTIEVVVHPQSVVHSMVEFEDGAVLAQMGTPDMRLPIAYALLYPTRKSAPVTRLDFTKMGSLTFEAPDLARFPCLKLAFEARAQGGLAPTVLNAANEVAVEAYLQERIGFYDIAALCGDMLDAFAPAPATCMDDVYHMDEQARIAAHRWLKRKSMR
nr:1-deoxy-D-xylulose-5-phosphate reductoisomerase [Maliibacterium massiliense]